MTHEYSSAAPATSQPTDRGVGRHQPLVGQLTTQLIASLANPAVTPAGPFVSLARAAANRRPAEHADTDNSRFRPEHHLLSGISARLTWPPGLFGVDSLPLIFPAEVPVAR